jgi:hypothetical protein
MELARCQKTEHVKYFPAGPSTAIKIEKWHPVVWRLE